MNYVKQGAKAVADVAHTGAGLVAKGVAEVGNVAYQGVAKTKHAVRTVIPGQGDGSGSKGESPDSSLRRTALANDIDGNDTSGLSSPSGYLKPASNALDAHAVASAALTRLESGGSAQQYGIAVLVPLRAKVDINGRFFVVVSCGEQAYRMPTSSEIGSSPLWEPGTVAAPVPSIKGDGKSKEKEDKGAVNRALLFLDRDSPCVARLSLFEYHTYRSNELVGSVDVDLRTELSNASKLEAKILTLDIRSPDSVTTKVGTLLLRISFETLDSAKQLLWERLLALADINGDGVLQPSEFEELMKLFAGVDAEKAREIFITADTDKNGIVSAKELAALLAGEDTFYAFENLVRACPICGERLQGRKFYDCLLHMTICFQGGTAEAIRSGYITETQAARGWIFRMTEWATWEKYEAGVTKGPRTVIIVKDRSTGRLVEEEIDPRIMMAMRMLYSNSGSSLLMGVGVRKMLADMSESQGSKMNDPSSAAKIPEFIEAFKSCLDLDDMKYPLDHYKTFNEFFSRELKDGARPISGPDDASLAVCAADARTVVFEEISEATRVWIKGKKFSVEGLFNNPALGKQYQNGSIAIFRLAPQDYHRFHAPVGGELGTIRNIPGQLYTVNPIAINSRKVDVFGENKRAIALIQSPEFGQVAFIAVGATMVGTIVFTAEPGKELVKGQELGYFCFGASTVIAVFLPNRIKFSEDLVRESLRGSETLVRMGTILGQAVSP